MVGTIFSIEEFSIYDGPGIRTSVFLKGCPLRCSWCHNPEGQKRESEIVKSPNGCVECGRCLKTAKVVDGVTVLTEESMKNCPMRLIRVCGETMESDELCKKLLKNERILNQGGGVTFSGGEPFVQSDFMFECLTKLEGKLHRAIQTCGYCSGETFEHALTLADYFLFDLKLIDEEEHIRYTGVSNRLILDNFRKLASSGIPFIARTPLIPGVTDTEENLSAIAGILKENGVGKIELLPYNKMAGGKYKLVMREYKPDFDETQEVCLHQEIFDANQIQTKIL